MALSPEGASLTEAHRLSQVRVAVRLAANLTAVWRAVDPTDLRGTLDVPLTAGVLLVQRAREESAVASQRYYVSFREAEGVEGTVEVPVAEAPSDIYVRGLLLGAGSRGVLNAFARGASAEVAKENGLVKALGSARRVVAGGGRDTILGAILGDPKAIGYQRVTDAKPCAFCSMVASRGILRYDEQSAGFEAHGHCGCTAEPAFEGSVINPRNARLRDAWQESTAGLGGNEALNAFRRHLAGMN